MVVFDATLLLVLLSAKTAVSLDSRTGNPIERGRERVDFLLVELSKKRTQIIIPTPALAEILVWSGPAGPEYLKIINAAAAFRVVPFEEKAAIEVAEMTREELKRGVPRDRNLTLAKLKYDRQIVAIARVVGASAIYTDDVDLKKVARRSDIHVVSLDQLPLPPDEPIEAPNLFEEVEEDDEEESVAELEEAGGQQQSAAAQPRPAIPSDGQDAGVRHEPTEIREGTPAPSQEPSAADEV